MAIRACDLLPPQFQREAQSAGRALRDAEGLLRLKIGQEYPESVSAITVGRQWHDGLIKKTEQMAAVIDEQAKLIDCQKFEIESLKRSRSLQEDRYDALSAKMDKFPIWVRKLFGAL
jgi:hypothetical protein